MPGGLPGSAVEGGTSAADFFVSITIARSLHDWHGPIPLRRVVFPSFKHLVISIQELLPRVPPQGLRQFGRAVTPAKLKGFAKAFGKLDARRATSDVGFDRVAGVGRKLQVQILGQE